MIVATQHIDYNLANFVLGELTVAILVMIACAAYWLGSKL